jgi:hypothetical protein
MNKLIKAGFVWCVVLIVSGCATMTLEGDGQKTAMSKTGTHTVHGSYYNFVWSAPPVTKCENGRGLYRVNGHTNAAYALVSLVSLGLYVPQTAEWWCDGTPNPDDDGPLYKPGH